MGVPQPITLGSYVWNSWQFTFIINESSLFNISSIFSFISELFFISIVLKLYAFEISIKLGGEYPLGPQASDFPPKFVS